jgi:hypothetical protein
MAQRLTLLLGLLFCGCAPHTHVHIYGRVYDVSVVPETAASEVEVWATDDEGGPTRRLAVTDSAGDYEAELRPDEREGGIGVIKPGHRSEWWPLDHPQLKLSQREADIHTKQIYLRVVALEAKAQGDRPAGRPMPKGR